MDRGAAQSCAMPRGPRACDSVAGVVCRADSSSEITDRPQPSEEEIQFILDAIAEYLTVEAWLSLPSSTCSCCCLRMSCHRAGCAWLLGGIGLWNTRSPQNCDLRVFLVC